MEYGANSCNQEIGDVKECFILRHSGRRLAINIGTKLITCGDNELLMGKLRITQSSGTGVELKVRKANTSWYDNQ